MNRTSNVRFMRRAFNRAAHRFDTAAILHRELLTRLLARLEVIRTDPKVILDLGSGTGHGSRALKKRFPHATVIAVDFAEGMLRASRKQQRWLRPFERVCADARQLPFKTESVDWVVSNAMLQFWLPPDAVLTEVQRVLKPGGLFSFCTFGPDTLRELRRAWTQVDDQLHVQPFIDMHDLGDGLVRAGFGDPVLDVESLTLTYPTLRALLNELKTAGSAHFIPDVAAAPGTTSITPTRKGLSGRAHLAALAAAYETERTEGVLPVSIEAVFGLCWQPQQPRRQTQAEGETRIPLSALRRQRG
jgi:malonyl-CoA O-methyltransferase